MGKLEKYELGRTLGEGNFAKVKLAKRIDSGGFYAIKILEKKRILELKFSDQIKREITALKMLRHPNIVRLIEVLASKSKIYMVLEYVNGNELFNLIAYRGKYSEFEARKIFQQIIDAVSYSHEKGVFHRDLKLENLLVDGKGNVKITDFGLSALSEQRKDDELLHTTCGSPNYVAPEILCNKGYDGAASDVWSCGVVLYGMLTGYLPFDDRNLAVLYQKISRGDVRFPVWVSAGAESLLKRILDPNPATRITMAEIKDDEWFKHEYHPAEAEDDRHVWDDTPLQGKQPEVEDVKHLTQINAFQLIGMSSSLDLSGFFEKEDVAARNLRFTSRHSRTHLLEKIKATCSQNGYKLQIKNGKLKVADTINKTLSVSVEVIEISESLHVVELRKAAGDSSAYKSLYAKLLGDLGGDA